MTDLDEFADRIREIANGFAGLPSSQITLLYSAEILTEQVLPSRMLTSPQAKLWLQEVCSVEDIDPPSLEWRRPAQGLLGAACPDRHTIALFDSEVSQLTLLHELAHLLSPQDGHGVEFCSRLVALCRQHISVEHGSLLHTLFGICHQPARWVTTH